jgi:quercetin dioxygenase-like cupin family protein
VTIVGENELDFVDLPGRRSANPLTTTLSEASLRIVELERTEGRTAHSHPFSEEIVYVAAGSGEVWIDGERHQVGQGDVVHIPTGVPHATIPAAGESMRLICFFPHPHLPDNIIDTDIQITEEGNS